MYVKTCTTKNLTDSDKFIIWSRISLDMTETHWVPHHFLLILPVDKDFTEPVVESDNDGTHLTNKGKSSIPVFKSQVKAMTSMTCSLIYRKLTALQITPSIL